MYLNLAFITVFAFIYSTVAGRIERSIVSGPILFLLFGLICGPTVLGLLDFQADDSEYRFIVDITLALVLFIDAANADLRVLRRNLTIPGRMLLIGMPLVIVMGVAVGCWLFPELGIFELCILATILAATDAALGKGVVSNKDVPARIREGLNAESGLNDGLAVPILFVFIALAASSGIEQDSSSLALKLVSQELGIGAVVGLAVTTVGVLLLRWGDRKGWLSEAWAPIFVVGLSLACLAVAQALHGSGYIAAFVGGLVFGYFAREHTHKLVHSAEGFSEFLAMTTWIIFGAVAVGPGWAGLSWEVALYALLSLTIIRVLPMVLALTGSGESMEGKLFLGWFGPRGLASIVFVIIVAAYGFPGYPVIESAVVCTITLCVLAHGFSANAWARSFGARSSARDGS